MTIPDPQPSMARGIALLAEHAATDEDHEILDLATWCHEDHRGAGTRQPDGSWGTCGYCAEPWPCRQWQAASAELTRWLVTSSTAIIRRAA
jgi:hypothetical protein